MWSVDTIVFSDDADTSLLVTPSGVAAAGTYTVELRNADVEFGSAFQFAFTCYPPPPPATIVRPLAGCGGTVARLPCCRNHCATWVMSESASNDLELLVLEVHDFPFDVTAASDLVATVGSMPATVETAEYYEAGADAESSNQRVNVNIPSDDSSCRSGRR